MFFKSIFTCGNDRQEEKADLDKKGTIDNSNLSKKPKSGGGCFSGKAQANDESEIKNKKNKKYFGDSELVDAMQARKKKRK